MRTPQIRPADFERFAQYSQLDAADQAMQLYLAIQSARSGVPRSVAERFSNPTMALRSIRTLAALAQEGQVTYLVLGDKLTAKGLMRTCVGIAEIATNQTVHTGNGPVKTTIANYWLADTREDMRDATVAGLLMEAYWTDQALRQPTGRIAVPAGGRLHGQLSDVASSPAAQSDGITVQTARGETRQTLLGAHIDGETFDAEPAEGYVVATVPGEPDALFSLPRFTR